MIKGTVNIESIIFQVNNMSMDRYRPETLLSQGKAVQVIAKARIVASHAINTDWCNQ